MTLPVGGAFRLHRQTPRGDLGRDTVTSHEYLMVVTLAHRPRRGAADWSYAERKTWLAGGGCRYRDRPGRKPVSHPQLGQGCADAAGRIGSDRAGVGLDDGFEHHRAAFALRTQFLVQGPGREQRPGIPAVDLIGRLGVGQDVVI